ncbi:MAG: 16S rRNA (cytosine(1402)-N(4))-methyltransferase RsmH [Clostridia bacterium]|nr:16S rRNA (cytosine(1402)-N(4))-methyltransferase RsmH [Clostridia bacterium]MBQ3007209.1 16S rRNA (cytosine(1402)-N(4))-methyltransferase RsmH [Clostridia bacterium]
MNINPAEFHHIPVLFNETIDSLNIKPDGIYVDCTSGGGGHSSAIAKRLDGGRLISIDRDPQAIETLKERLLPFGCVTVVHDNFFNIKNILGSLGVSEVDGILADLGVSSHQLDEPSRGFSFHHDAPLDMRMSLEGLSAAQAVNTLSQGELQRIIFEYGEEKFAPSISRAIVKARNDKPIETTFELSDIIKSAMPAAAKRDGHPARKTFQAIRIYVNGELDGLGNAVSDMFDCLKPGGRVSVITFHSLEDKTVKHQFASLAKGCTCPKNFPVCVCGNKPRAKVLKAVAPGEKELSDNSRSRSARLRTAEKL